jgi:hypothetical protein
MRFVDLHRLTSFRIANPELVMNIIFMGDLPITPIYSTICRDGDNLTIANRGEIVFIALCHDDVPWFVAVCVCCLLTDE